MKRINVRFIIQIAGKPQENVEKALNIVLEKLKSNENKFLVIESEIINSEFDKKTTLFSGFIEILIKFENINEILGFIVDYTPNSIEIEEPEKLNLNSNELTEVLNNMSSNLLKSQSEIRELRAHIHLMNSK